MWRAHLPIPVYFALYCMSTCSLTFGVRYVARSRVHGVCAWLKGVWAMSSGATCADVCSPGSVGGSGKGGARGGMVMRAYDSVRQNR